MTKRQKDALDELIIAGSRMSNALYNLKQERHISDDARSRMSSLVSAWDARLNRLSAELAKKGKAVPNE